LVSRHNATRTTCSPNRGGHPILLQVVGADLVGSARHNLLGKEDAGFNGAANAVVRNSERRGGLRHRQPFAVLLGRTVGMNAIGRASRQGRGSAAVKPEGTPEEVARAAGVSRATMSRIERGDRRGGDRLLTPQS
jgi:hypothetical protein